MDNAKPFQIGTANAVSHYFSGTSDRCMFVSGSKLCWLAADDPIHAPGSVFSPGFGSSAENACALALAEIGFGEHAIALAPLLRDALKGRGYRWTGGTTEES